MTRQSNIDRFGVGGRVLAMRRDNTPKMIAATVGHGITPTQVSRYITKKNTTSIDDARLKMVVAAISGLPTVRDTEEEGKEYYGKYLVDVSNPFSKYYAIARSGMSAQVSRAFISLSLKLTDGITLIGDERKQDALDALMTDLDFAALSQDIARSVCEMGTVVVLLRDEGGALVKPQITPMDYITLLTERETIGTVDADKVVHGDVERAVHDESNTNQIVYKREEFALFRMWAKYNYFTDIKGRDTFGIYGESMVPYVEAPLKSLLNATYYYNEYIKRHGLGRLHIDMRELARALSAGEITHAEAETVQEGNTAALQKIKSTEDLITAGDTVQMLTPGGTIDITKYRQDLSREIDRALLQSDVSGGNVGNSWTNAGSAVSMHELKTLQSMRDTLFATMKDEIIDPWLEQISINPEDVTLFAEPLFVPEVSSRDLIEMRLGGDITQAELRHRAGFPDEKPQEEI